jgi:hypothetical protein
MADDKAPRWDNEPPPGFGPDGKSLIVPKGTDVKYPETTIEGPDGKSYSPEEYEARFEGGLDLEDDDIGIEDDDDLSDLDELGELDA